jgi:hypothetical protein
VARAPVGIGVLSGLLAAQIWRAQSTMSRAAAW